MSIKSKAIGLLVSTVVTGGGSWLGYELNKPRTVKELIEWKGLALADEKDDNIWKALLFQNKDELKDKAQTFDALRKTCIESWNRQIDYLNKNYEYAEKYCTNGLRSRKARIIAGGFDAKELLSLEADYKTAFIVNRNSPGFLALLNKPSLTKDSEIDEEGNELYNAYKKYCEDSLNEDSSKIALTKQVCQKHPYSTAEEMANQDGYEAKKTEKIKEEWEQKYSQEAATRNKQRIIDSSLLKDINAPGENWTDLMANKDSFVEKFEKWCNAQKAQPLYKKAFLKEIYPKYITRCMVKTDSLKKLKHPLSPTVSS